MKITFAKIEKDLRGSVDKNILLILVKFKDYATISLLLIKYLIEKEKKHGIYITVNRPFNNLIDILKKNSINVSNLFFIDCITKKAGGRAERKKNCLFIPSPSNLTDLGIALSEAINTIKGANKFLFMDSVSTMLIYNNSESVAKFSHFVSSKLRVKGLNGILFSIESETDKKLINTISQFCDKTIRIGGN